MTDKEEAIERLNLHKELAQINNDCCIVNVKDVETALNLIQTQQAEIDSLKDFKEIAESKVTDLNPIGLARTNQLLSRQCHKLQEESEKKDNKLKDIKNHIKAELKMIDKLYNEVGWAGKEQYDGMKAAYKCLLNIYFENEVETEDK